MGQWEIQKLLEQNKEKEFVSNEIKKALRIRTIHKSLKRLRHFNLINFGIKIVAQKKGIKPVYVYWHKGDEDVGWD